MTPILLLIALAAGLVSYQKPKTGLLILVASLPAYLLRTELAGIPFTLLELMLLTFAGAWILKHRHLPITRLKPFFQLTLALLIIASIISVIIAIDTNAALGVWKAYFIEPILLGSIVMSMLEEGEVKSKHLFQAFRIAAIVISIVGIIQWITGAGIPAPWDIERRITSVFDYPNAVGLFLGPIVVISVLLATQTKKRNQILWIATASLSFLTLILAQSEAAIVAVIATLIIAGLISVRTRKFAIGATIGLLVLVLTIPPLSQKLTLQDYSGGVRLSQWSETTELLKNNWLFGVGLSGYPTHLEPYHDATHFEIFQYPHNIILNVWVELGLLGLLSVGFIGVLLLRALQTKPTSSQLIAILALTEITIHGLVDVPYFKNDLAILTWLLIIIALHPYVLRTKTR